MNICVCIDTEPKDDYRLKDVDKGVTPFYGPQIWHLDGLSSEIQDQSGVVAYKATSDTSLRELFSGSRPMRHSHLLGVRVICQVDGRISIGGDAPWSRLSFSVLKAHLYACKSPVYKVAEKIPSAPRTSANFLTLDVKIIFLVCNSAEMLSVIRLSLGDPRPGVRVPIKHVWLNAHPHHYFPNIFPYSETNRCKASTEIPIHHKSKGGHAVSGHPELNPA
ncbi:hypothetical protein L218DRAFT_948241 [Marasmius fiardii PR-910]|nr:hypothetical protein L218DRAFT_948241 [Marasmius fiardii PR-910]